MRMAIRRECIAKAIKESISGGKHVVIGMVKFVFLKKMFLKVKKINLVTFLLDDDNDEEKVKAGARKSGIKRIKINETNHRKYIHRL